MQGLVAAAVIDDFDVAIAGKGHFPRAKSIVIDVSLVQRVGRKIVVHQRRVSVICHARRRLTRRVFIVSGVIFIGGAHGDFVSRVVRGQGVGLAVGLGDRLAVALPLVAHAAIRHTIGIADVGGEFSANFCLTRDVHRAFVIRLYRRIGRVILDLQGEGFGVGATVTVVGRHLQRDGFVGRVVQMLAVFQLQRAVGGDFKAVVAHFVGVLVARIRVGRGQFAHGRAVFAFRDFAGGKLDVGRRVVGGCLRLHHAAFGVVAFFVARIVGVFSLDADFMTFVVGSQGVGFAVGTGDFFAVAQPLVAHFAFIELVGIMHFGGQRFTHFGVTDDGNVTFVVRLWLRRLWVRRRVVRVVLHVQGEGLVVGATVTVIGRHLQRDGFVGRVIQMFAVFQLQRAISSHFKAVVAHFVGVLVARIRVGRGQFAHGRTVFAFRDFACGKLDVSRRVVGRGLRLHYAAFGVVAFFVARVVGVFSFDADFMPFVIGGEGVGLAVGTGDFFAVAQPLVAHFVFVELVGVMHFGGQSLAYFGVAADGDVAFVVRLWLRLRVRIGICRVNHRGGRATDRRLAVLRVVGVGRAHGDGFTCLICGQLVAAAGCASNGDAIGEPLVLHVGRNAVSIIDFSG